MSRDFRSVDPAIRFSMTSTYKNSLNLPYRKKETNRIEQENQAFARRLFERTSNLNKKKEDYESHQAVFHGTQAHGQQCHRLRCGCK